MPFASRTTSLSHPHESEDLDSREFTLSGAKGGNDKNKSIVKCHPFDKLRVTMNILNGQMSHVNCRLRPGFTLIEILIFLLVIFALVTILLSATGVIRHNRNVTLTTVANEIAICEIERLRDLTFSALPAVGTAAIGAPCNADVTKLPPGPGSTANITVAYYQGDVDIKQITITVSWTEKGTPDSIQIETLKSKYGV